jgi:RNA polymerase sigma-70 factor (ECF subfamily)
MADSAARDYAAEADRQLVAALRAGDEDVFMRFVEQYQNAMVRIAMMYVHDMAVAEEVAQETWVAFLKGLDRFEGRSSLKTWLFTILTNRARTRATREARYVPLNVSGELDDDGPVVSPERFTSADHPDGAGWWAETDKPQAWDGLPEGRLLSQETLSMIMQSISALPQNQREVIRMRDVEGFSSEEVCNILSLSETNQRVLLHRARSRVREMLEKYLEL